MSTKEKSKLADVGLRQLLDEIQLSHSQDIATYTGGHLNESKLWKPPEESTHKSWKSALKPNITLVPPSTLPKKVDHSKANKIKKLKETLTTYSTGMLTEKNNATSEPLRDRVYIEELKTADLKFDKSKRQKGWSKGSPLEPLKQTPLPSNKDVVTKKDQFQAIMQFKKDLFPTSQTQQKTNFGDTTVNVIEERLERNLGSMPQFTRGTNFHRVQAFGGAFNELIDNSPTFGYMLKTIKNEYDAYLSFLLDSQLGKHRKLHDQVTQLSSRGTSKPALLQNQIDEVKKAELEAKSLLTENDRLRQELERELERSQFPPTESESTPRHEQFTKEEKRTFVTDIEDLNTNVLEKLNEVKRIRDKLHQEYVPAIVCNHLEQSIKDTEVDIQRSKTQKEYFNNTISETEGVLQTAIEYADTTEKDSSRIWEKVQVTQDAEGNVIIEDLDDDIDEEAKWNWYIS